MLGLAADRLHQFLSTPSARRATSNPWTKGSAGIQFLSTPSARRATLLLAVLLQRQKYFYPRPPRGGRRSVWRRRNQMSVISIHALREEGDPAAASSIPSTTDFYPRPPRGGRRFTSDHFSVVDKFLSTPSARRATAKTETKSLFSYKLYNILHEFRRALIYNGSKNYPNHAK